jgi:diguanylate cyclase (GGDEF)-like protein
VLTAVLTAASGGAESQARLYLLFVVVFASYFYPRREAVLFIAASGGVLALPLLYESAAVSEGVLRELAIGLPSYAVAGGAIIAGREMAARLRERSARVSEERERVLAQHASLRRVATAVATDSPSAVIFTLVASEALRLLGADGAAVMRYDGDHAELLGSCGPESTHQPPGARFPLRSGSELTRVRDSGEVVRSDGYPPGSRHAGAQMGWQCCVCAPVWVAEELWGALCVVARRPHALAGDASEQLLEFAYLVASSIANTERQSDLLRRASMDELTGLANHESFHDRLEAESARALRHRRPLSLALIDIDNFRAHNERLGHEASDRLLVEVAHVLAGLTRKGDLLARLGADELGLLLPETDKRSAFVVLERARQTVRRLHLAGVHPVTFTAGVCDLESAGGEGSLYRHADAALFWGKSHGRDVSWVYDPEIVRRDAPDGTENELEREREIAGLRALSRAIDAKDPLTREHSERVAVLAVRLAAARGWSDDRVALIESAALVHDVGKIGVPDAILLKPAGLEPDEYEVVKQHASLGAQIVEGVLEAEQVEWIRSHHERPDGRGYPNGLLAASLSEGAALLAIADAFDAMTSKRTYGTHRELDSALEECRALAGRQFTRDAVSALETVHECGLLAAA